MNKFGVHVKGLEDVNNMLKVLPKRTQNKIVPKALKRSAKPLIKAAKSKVDTNIVFKFNIKENLIKNNVSLFLGIVLLLH